MNADLKLLVMRAARKGAEGDLLFQSSPLLKKLSHEDKKVFCQALILAAEAGAGRGFESLEKVAIITPKTQS